MCEPAVPACAGIWDCERRGSESARVRRNGVVRTGVAHLLDGRIRTAVRLRTRERTPSGGAGGEKSLTGC